MDGRAGRRVGGWAGGRRQAVGHSIWTYRRMGELRWYCLESEVERYPALAGWRGLKDPLVRAHFNNTVCQFHMTVRLLV